MTYNISHEQNGTSESMLPGDLVSPGPHSGIIIEQAGTILSNLHKGDSPLDRDLSAALAQAQCVIDHEVFEESVAIISSVLITNDAKRAAL